MCADGNVGASKVNPCARGTGHQGESRERTNPARLLARVGPDQPRGAGSKYEQVSGKRGLYGSRAGSGRGSEQQQGTRFHYKDHRDERARYQGENKVRILITGGAGFIGSHIADAYLAAGHEVLVLDSLWEHGGGLRQNVPERALFVHMDVRDEKLGRIFQEFKPEIVSHHAAQHSVAISSRDPRYDADVNVIGMLNVLDNCVRAKVQKVIFASSGATFGTPDSLPMNENTPQRPESPYGITKMVTEHYLRFYKAQHGLDFTAFRYGNVYGPRQDPNGEAGVIAIFIGRFLAGQGVRIDWDGEQTRDYVYVKDVAQLNVIGLEKGSGTCYCIGTNHRSSVNEIFRTLCEISGMTPEVTQGPKRPGDARDAQFDYALAERELGWTPRTSLPEGMRETFDWFKSAQAVS